MSLLANILEQSDRSAAELTAYIDEYETLRPYDCMIDTARAIVSFLTQDYDTAEKWILSALRKNPSNHMNHFYYALIAKALGQYAIAAVECYITVNFATQFGLPAGWGDLGKQINAVLSEVGPKLSQEEVNQFVIRRNILNSPGSYYPTYRLYDQKKWTRFHGKFLYFDRQKQYNDYICIKAVSYMDNVNMAYQQALLQPGNYNLYAVTPTESWKAMKTNQFFLKEKDRVMAIAATYPNQTITISPSGEEDLSFTLAGPSIYHYINMDRTGSLSSTQDFIVSKPIPTKRDPGKKKLVLTIFSDAVSQWYLSETNFEAMPCTKAFFSKGMIFHNCFTTGEWTQPSVASLTTGLFTTRHHIIYRGSAYQFPLRTKIMGEIFNEAGYFTILVSGSTGISPYIGGLRGFDTLTHRPCVGFSDNDLIEDALTYMDAFPDTNKYISLRLFHAHTAIDDASKEALNLRMPVQTTMSFREAYAKTGGNKSVRNSCTKAAVEKYQAALRENDRQLKKVYDYITSHYAEEEYIVCFYSDHGVAVVSPENYLLKKSQTNSVLMLRGSGVPAGISEEFVNHFDYIPILAKLADISFDFTQYDCVLPRTFGGPGRDYVYSESIYHGQTYKAAIRNPDFECRFETNAHTDIDGLIDLSQGFHQEIFSTRTGEEIHDPELAEEFESIVFDHIKENIKY